MIVVGICVGVLSAGEVLVQPASVPGPLGNPLKGYCVYTDAGEVHQPYSMVFLYASWKQLEPVEGQYAFEDWEKSAWEHARAKGKHVVLRVYADYPGKPTGLPDWLLDQQVPMRAIRNMAAVGVLITIIRPWSPGWNV